MFRLIVLVALMLSAVPASAHHSFVRYDANKKVRVSGKVTGVRYQNPHVFFTLETADGSYSIETESVPVLRSKGLSDGMLKDGAQAVVSGWRGKTNAFELGLSSITIDGRTISVRGSTR